MTIEESTSSSGAMTMLTATNYTLWKPRMEDFLSCKDLFDPIDLMGVNPDPTKLLEWKKMNRKTIGQIRQWIDHSVFHHVAQETDAYALWKKLEDMYQAKTARNKALLMRRLVNMKLKSGTSIAEHTIGRRVAAIQALRDVQIEQLTTMLWIFRSSVSKDHLGMTVSQFFKENLPNLSISEMGKDGKCGVTWKYGDTDSIMDHVDERTVHASLLKQLSIAYPSFSAGIPPFGGFEFSNKSAAFDAEKLQIRNLVFDELFDSQMLELKDGPANSKCEQ